MVPAKLEAKRWIAVGAALLVAVATACGGPTTEDLVGTWQRSDDSSFVLTVSGSSGDGYELRFENTTTGDAQSIAGVVRPEGELQAALMVPQEPAGALAAGPSDVIAITLSLDGETLVVTQDAAGGEQPVELWRYERAEE